MNTDGSFECFCSTEGYQLSGDGLTCEGKECELISMCTMFRYQ